MEAEVDATLPPPNLQANPAATVSSLPHNPRPPLLPITNAPSAPPPAVRTTRLKRKNKKRRAKAVAKELEAGTRTPWQENCRGKKAAASLAHPLSVDVPLSRFAVSQDDGLTGAPYREREGDRLARTAEDFRRMEFELIEWDGVFVSFAF